MNLINFEVVHKTFGKGIVVSQENSYINVKFQQGEKKFPFPSAFDGYLTVQNTTIADSIRYYRKH